MNDFKFGKFCNTSFVIKTERDREAVIKRLDDFYYENSIKQKHLWLTDKRLPFKLFLCNDWGCQYSSDIHFHHNDYKDIELADFLKREGGLFEIE